MTSDTDIKQQIITAADDLFFTYGYARVAMAEIAAALRMSKKTIYKHFAGKEALLQAVMERFCLEIEAGLNAILNDDQLDFTAKVSQMLAFMGGKMSKLQSRHMLDIQREATAVWKYFQDFRERGIENNIRALLGQGSAAGMLRQDLNLDLVQLIILTTLERITSPDSGRQPPLNEAELLAMTMSILFEGILTDTGRANYRVAY